MELEQLLKKIITGFKDELGGIRASRPTSKLVEDIKVNYLEQQLPVKQLGSIGIVPPREIQINVWDKNAVAPVAKAIEDTNIGIHPSIQGNLIRLNLPPLTEERRQELIKLVKKMAEDVRIRVRSLRDDHNKKVKRAEESGEIREDERFKQQEKIQELVDKANKDIEASLENKIKEIQE